MASLQTLPKGTVIGGHTIGKVLGHGGFGVTYLAQQNATGDVLAIKEYFPIDYAERQRNGMVRATQEGKRIFDLGLETFLREANLLKTLPRQKNLVRVRGAFSKAGTAYCLMEFIEGDPLDKILPRMMKRYGAVPEALIRAFTLSLTSALQVVHHSHLLHRDVKPGNVMLRKDDQQPVLIDFGAARSLRENAQSTTAFTRRYAALEQFVSPQIQAIPGLKEGPWSDLFSLSVVLYEMIARAPPHRDAEERFAELKKTGRDPYIPVAEMARKQGIKASYSTQLTTLIDKGCALMPKDRPRDAAAFCALLGERVPKPGARDAAGDTSGTMRGARSNPAGPSAAAAAARSTLSPKTPLRFGKLSGSVAMVLLILALALISAIFGVMMQ